MRAARIAGKRPPMRPTASASKTPCAIKVGVSWKLNTTCVKLEPSVEAVNPSKMKNAAKAPMTPPIAASVSDSISVPTNAGTPLNPMARNVAISVARAATDEYIVLSAPASAPNAIAMASGQPSFWMRSEVLDAWSAK